MSVSRFGYSVCESDDRNLRVILRKEMALIVDIFVRKVEGQSCGLNELSSQQRIRPRQLAWAETFRVSSEITDYIAGSSGHIDLTNRQRRSDLQPDQLGLELALDHQVQ